MSRTHYQLLGVDRSATAAEIKKAFRDLSWDFHPDRAARQQSETVRSAYAEMTRAYSVLADEEQRRAYDASLDVMTDPCPACRGEGRTWKQKGFTARVASPCTSCGGTGRITRR